METPRPPAPCPFAPAGLNSSAMAACPGYRAEMVTFTGLEIPGDYTGRAHPTGTSCSHLVAAASRRGYRAACAHPDGRPLDWPRSADLRGVAVPMRRALPSTRRASG